MTIYCTHCGKKIVLPKISLWIPGMTPAKAYFRIECPECHSLIVLEAKITSHEK